MTLLSGLGILLPAVVVVCIVWRYAQCPCPSWLVPLLENPYFQAVASAAVLLQRAGVRPGMRVLDAGCGPGRLTVPTADRVGPTGHVTALDLQPGMLAKRARAPRRAPHPQRRPRPGGPRERRAAHRAVRRRVPGCASSRDPH